MKTSLASPAMLAAFAARGGQPKILATGDKALHLTRREWADRVRGNVVEEVDTEILAERTMEAARESRWLKLNGELVA